MPMQRSLYPPNWGAIALEVKNRAKWRCQQCGRPCRRPGQDWSDFEVKKGWLWPDAYDDDGAVFKRGRFVLTVAHLNHRPEDCRPENLRALCAPCHCRYDLAAMAQKRMISLERKGQLSLPL